MALPRIRCARIALAWLTLGLVLGTGAGGGITGRGEEPGRPPGFIVDAWQNDDGLPQSSVLSMVQTPDGYLWVATFNGLARFDGVSFKIWDTSNTPHLPGNRLVRLSSDREGALWLVTEQKDVAQFKDGRCRTFTTADGLPAGGVDWVQEDAAGRLWLAGSKGGLFWRQDQRFVPAPAPAEFAEPPLGPLVTDGEGGVWLTHRQRLFGYRTNEFTLLPGPESTVAMTVTNLWPGRDGDWWALTSGGLRRYAQGAWQREAWPCPDFQADITAACADLAGHLWVATYSNGLFRFDPTRGWLHLTVEDGLTTLSLRSLLCDREGNLWVGTDGGGLLRVKPRLWRMITWRDGLGIDAVHSVSQDARGRLWFAGGRRTPYWLDQGRVSAAIPQPPDSLESVWAVLASRDGATWIGTYRGQVFHFRDQDWTRYGRDQGQLAGSVRALLEDRQGVLWVGGFEGLSRIEPPRVTHYSRRDGLSSDRVWALAEDSRGRLYIGTAGGGLNQFEAGRFTVYTRAQGLPDEVISALYADADDTLWIGTHGGGLSRFRAGRFFNYRVPGGLPARSVGPLLEDDDGFLWMASDLGFVRVNRQLLNQFADGQGTSLNHLTFGRGDGLATVEMAGIQPACLKARDGTLWFGTAKGVASINPRALSVNPLPPPVVIDEVRIDDQTVAPWRAADGSGPASPGDRLTLLAHQRRIEFRFAGLSLVAPAKVRFRYQMEGFDPDWVEGGTQRSVSYTRLPPGTYRFRVTACNNDGVWNQSGAALGLVVAPAFHQTWPFRLLVLAAGAALLGLFHHLRLTRLDQLTRLRARIANDLHDEIGSNLGGVLLLSELAQQAPDLPPETHATLREINTSTQRTATAMRDIVWFLNPDFDTLADMIVRMRGFAGDLLAGLEREFRTPQTVPTQSLPLEFRRNVFFAFKEILHNIARHARATHVRIEIEIADRRFLLRVTDNGQGFDPATATPGSGLRSLRLRAARLGGTLSLDSHAGQGTTVTLVAKLS